jgi:hypothetical protein
LFDEDATVEDPVGSAPFSAADSSRRLEDFYDIFIAGSEISFIPCCDFVCGYQVVRDGYISVTIEDGSRIMIPVFLRYEVSVSAKIARLRAHWKFITATYHTLGHRPAGVRYLATIGRQIYSATGLRGIGGFARAAVPAAFGSKLTLHRLKSYLETGRYTEASSLFSFFEGGEIAFYTDVVEVFPAGYLTMGKLRLLSVDKLIDCGNTLAFRCEVQHNGHRGSGIAFMSLSAAGFRIRRLEIFLGGV